MKSKILSRPVPAAAAVPPAANRSKAARTATLWTRRDLLSRSAWGLVAGTWAIGTAAAVRLLYPRVHFNPPTLLVLGAPTEFAVGEVCERWKKSHHVILVREVTGFYALRSVCTHLGCIPDWDSGGRRFKCPCHGSAFTGDGVNIAGPAPRALERLKIFLDEDGQVVVDTAVRFRREDGDWRNAAAYLAYPSSRQT